MGQLASLADTFNPVSAVTSTVKACSHDCAAYVLNAAMCASDCCGCWRFKVQTFETSPEKEQEEASFLGVTWH